PAGPGAARCTWLFANPNRVNPIACCGELSMRTLIGLGFLSLCGLSFAAAPVEDLGSRGQPPVMEQPVPTVAPVPAGPAPSQNQPLTELYFEVQALRDEVRDLRGQLEEQGNQL